MKKWSFPNNLKFLKLPGNFKFLRLPDNLNFLKKGKFSQRKILFLLIGIVAVILAISLGVLPLIEAKKKAEEEIILKKRALLRYEQFLQNRKSVEEDLARTSKEYEGIQLKLLSGETPQLGAANLQEIVKRVSVEIDGRLLRVRIEGCAHRSVEDRLVAQGTKPFTCVPANLIVLAIEDKLDRPVELAEIKLEDGACQVLLVLFEQRPVLG